MGYLKERSGFSLIGRTPPGTCPMCAVKHDPALPHNKDSLAYQYKFYDEHGRWPTWADAMAHCSEEVKTNIFPLRNGLDFLGFHTYLTEGGKVIRKVRRSSKGRMARKLRKYEEQYRAGEKTRKEIEDSYRSWRSHASHGNCRSLVLKYDQRAWKIFHPERSENLAKENQRTGRGGQGKGHREQV